MLYGLYLSAAGVTANSYRQDVHANNLANAETVGFKRDIPLFQQRLTAAQEARVAGRPGAWSDPVLEGLGGGLFVTPTATDQSAGEAEQTGSPLDVAIEGKGYFRVAAKGQNGTPELTRDGRFMVDRAGYLVLSNSSGHRVLDPDGRPIQLPPGGGGQIVVGRDGSILQNNKPVARIGVFDVPDRTKLVKRGGTLLTYPDANAVKRTDGTLHGGALERSNVDPVTELTQLMETQRQLEANANMIRYQDQTLQKLVDVGKIG
jgi:flagellar basal-body rod protein FlgF